MNRNQLKTKFIIELAEMYSKREAERLFFIFLEEWEGISKTDFLIYPKKELSNHDAYLDAIFQLKKGKPFQYILGEVNFLQLKLKVSSAALIPRPETEELAILVKESFKNFTPQNVLDVGTGTGCLALAMKCFYLNSNVVGLDISKKAISLANFNAKRNHLDVNYLEVNFLNEKEWPNEIFDLIIGNPPYISISEKKSMDKNVLDFEPNLAFFVENVEPLIFYQKITAFSQKYLSKKGRIAVEINQRFGKETLEVFKNQGFEAELRKDLSGNDRFVLASR